MRAFKILFPTILLVVGVSVLQAATIHVPGDQSTIQAGIDVAVDGDTVLVADGNYTGDGNRDIYFVAKDIVVMSENGPENCIIDCEGSAEDHHRGFYLDTGDLAVLNGFTIMNGYELYGGGIYCNGSTTIVNNIITQNASYDLHGGAGIHCGLGACPCIINNLITENDALGYNNGGAGGIYCLSLGQAIIKGNTISYNTACRGGGISAQAGALPIIQGNYIIGNTATWGAGMFIYGGGTEVHLNLNTFYNNIALDDGCGICSWGDAHCNASNCILWDDPLGEINLLDNGTIEVSYSDVNGGWSGVGNISEIPSFVDPSNNDFRLLSNSPCIDAGDPDMPSRPWGGWCLDMGAYEYDQGFYWDGENVIPKPFKGRLQFKR